MQGFTARHTTHTQPSWRGAVRLAVGVLLGLSLLCDATAQRDKRAQTGFKFLALSLDARSAAMGDAMTALEGDAAQLFYNPAGVAFQEQFLTLALGQVDWIADIKYNQASLTLKTGNLGVLGFTLMAVDYGEIQETFISNVDDGFELGRNLSPTAFSAGVAFARALSDRFAFGVHFKYARQSFGDVIFGLDSAAEDGFERRGMNLGAMAYDFGVLYKTGFRDMTFAFSARNFSEEISFLDEGFQMPLTLKIGVAMNMLGLLAPGQDFHQFRLAVETEKPRDFDEQIKIGGEYLLFNTLALRAGYIFPTDEQGINAGIGVQQSVAGFAFAVDYAYTDFGIFSDVQRLSLRLSL